MAGFPLLSVLLFLPMVVAFALLFIPRISDATVKGIALATVLIELALSLVVTFTAGTGAGLQWEENYDWLPGIGVRYHLGTDGMSTMFLLLVGITGVIALVASWESIRTNIKAYYVSYLLLMTGMVGVFTSFDLVLFYIFWELVLIPMALIIGVWGSANRVYAAIKFFLFTLAGSLLMLVGIVALYTAYYNETGVRTTDLIILAQRTPQMDLSFQLWTFAAFFAAFAIKVPMFPVHTWLPDAHVESPTAGSVVLAAVLLKMGAYGMMRFNMTMFPQAAREYAGPILVLSTIAIIYGAVVAIVQPDMKKLVAYTSVSHMGFVTLGIFSFTPQGWQGALINMFSHGLVTGGLFLCVGVLYERAHTRQISAFGGIATRMPTYASIFMVFMLAALGLPGLSGFVGEYLSILGAFRLENKLYAVISMFVVIFAAVYMMWMYKRVIFGLPQGAAPPDSHGGHGSDSHGATHGDAHGTTHDAHAAHAAPEGAHNDAHAHQFPDLRRVEYATLVPLMIAAFFVGIYPVPFMEMLAPVINALLGPIVGVGSPALVP